MCAELRKRIVEWECLTAGWRGGRARPKRGGGRITFWIMIILTFMFIAIFFFFGDGIKWEAVGVTCSTNATNEKLI
jgi:hypothetical protein